MPRDRDTYQRYSQINTRLRVVSDSSTWTERTRALAAQGASEDLIRLVLAFIVARGVATAGARAMDKLGILESLPSLLSDPKDRHVFAQVFASHHAELASSPTVLEQSLESSVVTVVANAVESYSWIFPVLSSAQKTRWPLISSLLEKKRKRTAAVAAQLFLLARDLQPSR